MLYLMNLVWILRLQNSKMLTELVSHLAHLPEAQRDNIVEVFVLNKSP